MGLIIICALFAMSANSKVKRTYAAQREIPNRARMNGYDTATRLLRLEGVKDISVGRVHGELSDHYHPMKKIVNLSQDVYATPSVASVAIAAHEIGHVMQNKKGYFPYKVRSALVPVTNLGAKLAIPLVLVGCVLDIVIGSAQNSLGFTLAMVGVIGYGLSALFALVTLPVEFDASRRAKKMLLEQGILTHEEIPYADKMLDAAANTYLASLVVSLAYFLASSSTIS